MGGHIPVDGIRQDTVVSVEEEDDDQGECQRGAELCEGADLGRSGLALAVTRSCGHGRRLREATRGCSVLFFVSS